MRLWTAEREISMEEAATLVASQFPELTPARLKSLGAGFDNTAYLVNEQFVFRFPRRELSVSCMQAECSVLPYLNARLPSSVPEPLFLGRPAADYPWPFAGYRLLPGRTACAVNLDDGQRARLARPLARFLAALHEIPLEEAYQWGARSDTLGRLDAQKRIPMARAYLDRVSRLGLISNTQPFTEIIDDYAKRSSDLENSSKEKRRSDSLALLHGDMYARHLLMDEAGGLWGVIDWGSLHVGRPAVDLAVAHSFLPPEAHGLFREAYGVISEEDWRLARFRALYHTLIFAAYAHDAGDEDLLREGLLALRYISG